MAQEIGDQWADVELAEDDGCRDLERSARPESRGLELGLRVGEVEQDLAGPRVERRTGLGQGKLAGGSLDEADAEAFLEARDDATHAGRTEGEILSRFGVA